MKKTFLCEKKVRRAIGLLLAFLLVFAYSCPTGIYAEASEKAPFTVISNEKELEVYKAEKTTSFEGMSVSFYSVDVEADSSITISGEDISVIIDYLPAGGEYDNLPVTMSIPTEGDPTISAVCTAGGIDDLAELIGEYESLASVYDPVGLNWSNTNSKAFRVEGIIGEEELAILTIRWVKSESDGDERVGFSLTAEDNTSVDVKSAGNYTLSGKELSLPMDLYFADLEGDSVTMDFDEGSAFAKLMDPLQSGLSFEGDNDFPATLEAPSGDVAKNSLTTLPWIDLLKYFKLESESTAQIAGLYSGIEGGWTNEGYRAYSAYVLYDAEEEMPKGILLLRWKAEETQTFDFGISDVSIDRGVSYSPFIENNDTYEFVLDNGVKDGTAILSFQVSDGVTNVKYGSDEDTVIEDGTSLQANEQSYQIQVAIDNNFVTPVGYDYNQSKEKKIYVALQKGNQTRVITLVVHQRAELALPLADSVVDYLCVGSQFTNGGNQNTGIYGWYPEKTLIGAYMSNTTWPNSLGNFGGYITYYFNTPITDDPKNPYGVDFTVYGNSFDGTSGASEPGAVMVSENGSTWYELAGSVFYDDSTTWNAEVTYQYNADSTTYKLSDGRNGAFNYRAISPVEGSMPETNKPPAMRVRIDGYTKKISPMIQYSCSSRIVK